jgi:hypothetical protein
LEVWAHVCPHIFIARTNKKTIYRTIPQNLIIITVFIISFCCPKFCLDGACHEKMFTHEISLGLGRFHITMAIFLMTKRLSIYPERVP